MTEAVLEAGSWIYKMLVTLVMAVVCVAIVGLVIKAETNTIDVQRELLFNRILYDPQGFLYVDGQDRTGVTQTGVFDKSRFDQTVADQAFVYLPNYGGAAVTLVDGGVPMTPILINGPTYESIRVMATSDIEGSGTLVRRTYPVRIYDNGARLEGWLEIIVAMLANA